MKNEKETRGACCGCEMVPCAEKTKERDPKEYKDLVNRLNRIEGQIRGIKAMVERGAYCPDILVQASAANAALNSFSKTLLSNHIRTCVRNDIREGNDEVVEELVTTLQKMMK
ncbi:MAG: metal-sensing transcriptional repressor [Clostridia bacterium]|nr:metal-sensing transcriptional repressor [Clostridia bacterium]